MYDLVPFVQELSKELLEIFFFTFQLAAYQYFKNESA